MKKFEVNQAQSPAQVGAELDPSEISDEELDDVSGGIIIVGGIQSVKSRFDAVSLNPQPLPPRYLNIGYQR